MKRKKNILAIACLAVASAALLTACSTPLRTGTAIRWETREEYVFDISVEQHSAESNKLVYKDVTYTKDYQLVPDNYDEIKPLGAAGTYKLEISTDASNTYTETEQTLYTAYDKENVTVKAFMEKLTDADKNLIVPAPSELPDKIKSFEDTSYILKSFISTKNTFALTAEQKPVKSEKVIRGFYLGNINQEITELTINTVYTFGEKEASAEVTVKKGSAAEQKQTNKIAQTAFIDASQLMLYTRSLNKDSSSFQDQPAAYVYDPLTNRLAQAAFTLSRAQNALFTKDGDNFYAVANAVSVSLNNTSAYIFYNAPGDSKNPPVLDAMGVNEGSRSKFTVTRFQNGYYTFELQTYNEDLVKLYTPAEKK